MDNFVRHMHGMRIQTLAFNYARICAKYYLIIGKYTLIIVMKYRPHIINLYFRLTNHKSGMNIRSGIIIYLLSENWQTFRF